MALCSTVPLVIGGHAMRAFFLIAISRAEVDDDCVSQELSGGRIVAFAWSKQSHGGTARHGGIVRSAPRPAHQKADEEPTPGQAMTLTTPADADLHLLTDRSIDLRGAGVGVPIS
ncbi:hypothetical protein SETIT_5G270800v2 [Setaria italica]|uniref:Uncharacterized protein n=1 Tax=Setaria italica TaxID=4555 RepID=A0A368R978_SETIT|nr:hypothetical protein SETIT_5G270800v2 [Setaria italica]